MGVRNQWAQFSTTVTLLASGHWLRGACTGDVNCRTTGPSHRQQCLVQRDIPSEAPSQTGHYQARIIKRGGHGVAGPGTGRKAVWSMSLWRPTLNPEYTKHHARGSKSFLKHPNHQVIKVTHIQRATKYLKDVTLKKHCVPFWTPWWTPWVCLGQALGLNTQLMAQKQCWIFAVQALATKGVMWSSRT